MNTDAELEQALLGTWDWGKTRSGEDQEFTFKPAHAFTGRVGPHGVWGYWDIREGHFRMGPTVDQVEQVPIRLDGAEVEVVMPGGQTHRWIRKAEAGASLR